MTFDHDDPRWTAYVLDELEDNDKAELESQLEKNAEARAYVEELRQTTDFLALELGGGEAAMLTDAQRAAITEAASETGSETASGSDEAAEAEESPAPADVIPIRRSSRRGWWIGGLGLATAAAAALLVLPRGQEKISKVALEEGRFSPASRESDRASVAGRPAEAAAASKRSVALDQGQSYGYTSSTDRAIAVAKPSTGVVSSDPHDVDVSSTESGLSRVAVGDVTTTAALDGYRNSNKNVVLGNQRSDALAFRLTRPGKPAATDDDGDADPATEKVRPPTDRANTESYDHVVDNPFVTVADDPRSTFSIDVDTAAYANMRRFLNSSRRPPQGAVRIEEMINYFSYEYPGPRTNAPFAVHVEMTQAPWNRQNKLMKIGIKGKEVSGKRPSANLVFLLDVSGSMESPNKLPLLRRAMSMLVDNLGKDDRVAIAVYAGASGLVLPPTPVSDKHVILSALERLQAGGSTNGGKGIELAYQVAAQNFVDGGINRVILATDGDFNVGTTSRSELVRLIEKKAKSGVFLTVLGFGMGNYKDATLEQLADHGNGNYAYIDTIGEARKVLVREISSTLVTIAKDVKIQLEFNPRHVSSFRLIGYENRVLAHQDFNDDKKDAGDIGAGHTVTALYELVPAGSSSGGRPAVDPLKYQRTTTPTEAALTDEWLTLKMRYKAPDGDTSKLSEWPITDRSVTLDRASRDLSFAAAVAAFGMILRDSRHRGDATLGLVEDLATRGAAVDRFGYRAEFLDLVKRARRLGVQ